MCKDRMTYSIWNKSLLMNNPFFLTILKDSSWNSLKRLKHSGVSLLIRIVLLNSLSSVNTKSSFSVFSSSTLLLHYIIIYNIGIMIISSTSISSRFSRRRKKSIGDISIWWTSRLNRITNSICFNRDMSSSFIWVGWSFLSCKKRYLFKVPRIFLLAIYLQ